MEKRAEDIYVDEPCVVSFWIGELGHLLQYHQGFLRYLKLHVFKDHKFIIFMNQQFHVFVHDFVNMTIDLPKEFYDLGLETDCAEAPPPDSPPGSLTPPELYSDLIRHFRQFYNQDKAKEFWPTRGCNFKAVQGRPQVFTRYTIDEKLKEEKPIICVFPRGRARSAQRNVPEFIWKEVVDKLREDYVVVLGGTPSGSFLADYEGDRIINLIKYNDDDKMDRIIAYICSSECTISSQSGLSHVSLFTGIPTCIIGHEKNRHAVAENRVESPVSFRYVYDYRAIDADTIIADVDNFLGQLKDLKSKVEPAKEYSDILDEDYNKMLALGAANG